VGPVTPTPTPPGPVVASSPLAGPSEPQASKRTEPEDIPLPLTLVAAGLVVAAAASVAAFGRA
jgi:hypothetical protein